MNRKTEQKKIEQTVELTVEQALFKKLRRNKPARYIKFQGEDMTHLLLTKGRFFNGFKVKRISGYLANMCQYNASVYWYNRKSKCRIVIGYAASGAFWWEHAWCIMPREKVIIEMTPSFKKGQDPEALDYYGYVLSQEQCLNYYELFKDAEANYYNYLKEKTEIDIEKIPKVKKSIIKKPTLKRLEQYARYKLQKEGFCPSMIFMMKGQKVFRNFIEADCREELYKTRAFLKKTIKDSSIKEYWMIRNIWVPSNTSVPAELNKNKKEAVLISEYKIGKEPKITIIIHTYETKDGEIVFNDRIESETGNKDKWDFYKDV